jgi:hypothetical protein
MAAKNRLFLKKQDPEKIAIPPIPTATVNENRIAIFQPTDRPKERTTVIQIKDGTVKVVGKLGQAHKDLLELIRYMRIDFGYTRDGRLAFLVDPYRLRKGMSAEKGEYSYERFWKIIEDLIRTYIEIETPTLKAAGSFLTHVVESKIEVPHSKTGKPRKLMRIEFSKLGTTLIEEDIKIFYDPIPIAQLKHGISKAVARYVKSHKNQPNGGWKLDTILKAMLGEDAKTQAIKNAKRFLRKDVERLKKCGIFIENDRVFLENTRNP